MALGLRLNVNMLIQRIFGAGGAAVTFGIAQAGTTTSFIALAGQTTDVLLQAGQ